MEYHYRDILLLPKHSQLNSRSEASLDVQLGNHTFAMPVVPANMKTVVNEDICVWLAEQNYFYVMHRFGVDSVAFTRRMRERGLIASISLGVNEDSYDTVSRFVDEGDWPDYITIDIAHGHCEKMAKMLAFVKYNLPKSFVIAGNVCTPEGVQFLEEKGASAVKVGIGPGCFIAGTKVLTKRGEINIEDVQIGDKVLTHLNNWMSVSGKSNRIEEDRLITINGNITCTPQHEFYVVHKKYHDKITEDNIEEYAEWVSAENITKEYLLVKYE